MTLREWLRSREPVAPERLASRIEEVLATVCGEDASDAHRLCLDAAESLLRDLLDRPSAGRESALDLLTVDALVTYAFEAAASEPATLEPRAREVMRRFAVLTA